VSEIAYTVKWKPDLMTRRRGWWRIEFTDELDGRDGPLHYAALSRGFSGYAYSGRAADRAARRAIKKAQRGLRRLEEQ
jgi:hypothetical protein